MIPGETAPSSTPAPDGGEARARVAWGLLAVVLLVHLPFLGQAYHVDDANFLVLARGAALDPWRPHLISINWLGEVQPAFDVLSNPPGVAWLLALGDVLGGGERLHHALILPWTLLAAWGGLRLARRFCLHAPLAGAIMALCPAVMVCAHTVMPDLPLLGCYLAGLALTLEGLEGDRPRRALFGAGLLGCASLFRYSGLTALPLLVGWLVLYRGRIAAPLAVQLGALVMAASPIAALVLHDVHAYGRVHLLAMFGFQQGEDVPGHEARLLLAQLSFLGGIVVAPGLPLVLLARSRRQPPMGAFTLAGAGLGAGFTLAAASHRPIEEGALIGLCLSTSLLLLWPALRPWLGLQGVREVLRPGRRTDEVFLSLWALGVLVFNQFLRFVSARYLLLAVAPLVLLGIRHLERGRWPATQVWWGLVVSAALGLGLAVADARLADVYRQFARQLEAQEGASGEGVYVAGHWGLQHYLEGMGALAVSESTPLPAGARVVEGMLPWPQDLTVAAPSREELGRWVFEDPLPLRTVSWDPPACFYANAVAPGGRAAWLPWSLSRAPLEVITVWRVKEVP